MEGFCVSKWFGLDNKNSIKHYENNLKALKTSKPNSPWVYIREGLLSEGFLRLRFGGLIFGRAYFLFLFFFGGGVLIIGILRVLPSAHAGVIGIQNRPPRARENITFSLYPIGVKSCKVLHNNRSPHYTGFCPFRFSIFRILAGKCRHQIGAKVF